MTTPNWDDLPESARNALVRLAQLFSDRFTGKIELECNGGGVNMLSETRRRRPVDLTVEDETQG